LFEGEVFENFNVSLGFATNLLGFLGKRKISYIERKI
jgi:hypothetical protein